MNGLFLILIGLAHAESLLKFMDFLNNNNKPGIKDAVSYDKNHIP